MSIRVLTLLFTLTCLSTSAAKAAWDESWLLLAVNSEQPAAKAPKAEVSSGSPVPAISPAPAVSPVPAIAPMGLTEAEMYSRATSALDAGRYQEAIEYFREVEAMRGTRADRAIYWKAYSQAKLSNVSAALEALRQLEREYPKSKWNKDAEALALELRAASGRKVAPEAAEAAEDEELKLMILNSLMSSDPEKAVPLIQKLLKSDNTERVKKQALFILAQSGSPEAMQILGTYAKGEADPELQRSAVEYLGLYGGEENAHLLEQIYIASPNIDVRRKILEAYMLSGDGEKLLAVAKKEKEPSLRRSAIEQLGLIGRTDALEELYRTESDIDLRRRIIESFMLAGESDRLYELARKESEPKLRRTAIEHLGLMGQTEQLWQLYTTETDPDLRRRILESFMLTGDSQHLTEVARSDKDIDLRRSAIEQLGLLGESSFLHELYYTESDFDIKAKIIEGLFLMSDDVALIEIARKEKNRDLKRSAIEKLTMINSDEATEFMLELLDK